MQIKTTLNYSPNFNPIKRPIKKIKFLIFHYTGMKKESDAINRLTDIQSEVGSHYLIKYNGEIVLMVPNSYIAWHAGRSSWGSYRSINKNSIGIEISNPGHNFNYKNFSKKQIISLLKLSKFLIKKYKINPKNILGHSDIAPERKKDPGEKFPWKILANEKLAKWHNLDEKKIKTYRSKKLNKIQEKTLIKNIYFLGYNKIRNFDDKSNKKLLLIAFQRRFRQGLINGKFDLECLIISKNLLKY